MLQVRCRVMEQIIMVSSLASVAFRKVYTGAKHVHVELRRGVPSFKLSANVFKIGRNDAEI